MGDDPSEIHHYTAVCKKELFCGKFFNMLLDRYHMENTYVF